LKYGTFFPAIWLLVMWLLQKLLKSSKNLFKLIFLCSSYIIYFTKTTNKQNGADNKSFIVIYSSNNQKIAAEIYVNLIFSSTQTRSCFVCGLPQTNIFAAKYKKKSVNWSGKLFRPNIVKKN
jgi:hypothetical protein